MRGLRTLVIAALTATGAAGCNDAKDFECPTPVGASATCDQACNHLFSIHCRVGKSREECIATCGEATATTDATEEAMFGRARACYLAATSCDDVNACSLGCGPMDSPVPFVGGFAEDAGPSCDDDDGEDENDSVGTAPGAGVPSSSGGIACPLDPDFLSFGISPGTTYDVTLTFTAGTATLRVLDMSDVELGNSGEGPSPRTVSFRATAAGTAFAGVESAAGAGDYTLEIASP
jgi:hypothetical protein